MTRGEVLTAYDIGHVAAVDPLSGGIIHETWKVATDRGTYVLQKVSPIFAPIVMEDIAAVLRYLRERGATVPRVVPTRSRELALPDGSSFWRMYTYVPGRVYGEGGANEAVAYEAGKLLGAYHRLLDGFTYEFKHRRPIKHNIPLLYAAYRKAVTENADPEIAQFCAVIDRMSELDLPSHFRKNVHHGDAKISNFIFSERGAPEAITMVDFDDCGRSYNILHELGGFFRSVCWTRDEQTRTDTFSLTNFEAGLRGYRAGAGDFLNGEEWEHLSRVIGLNLLQLASRFVRDYVEDSYFVWDPSRYPSRKAHNLARAQEHLALFADIERKQEAILEIVQAARTA